MITKLLIIGSNRNSCDVGSMLLRASKSLNCQSFIYDNNPIKYAPSMQTLKGKIFFKIANRRPYEWWSFNKNLLNYISKYNPQIIIVTGIFPLEKYIFSYANDKGIKVVNFLTDNPFARRLKTKSFLSNIKNYDVIFSTKSNIKQKLFSNKAKDVKTIFYSYDPFWHHLPDKSSELEISKFSCDISFIGTGAKERLKYLNKLSSIKNIKRKVYGNSWEGINIPKWEKCGPVLDNEFRLAMFYSKLSICLLRKSSKDVSTQRTFEIAPCGGCGLYEDTNEHREIFKGYPEYGFFSSPEDLLQKCKWLLNSEKEREEMKRIGFEILKSQPNTYYDRLSHILKITLGRF